MQEFRDTQEQETNEDPVDAMKEIGKLKNMVTGHTFSNQELDINNEATLEALVEKAGYDPSQFSKPQFYKGYKVEQEHNDVTKGDQLKIAEIVLAHLREIPDYYDRLEKMEAEGRDTKVENSTFRRGTEEIGKPFKWTDRQGAINAASALSNRDSRMSLIELCSHVISERNEFYTGDPNEMTGSAWQSFKNDVKRTIRLKGDYRNSTRTIPSNAQISAGNYKKEHVSHHGLDISIENPIGSTRQGTDETGTAWEQVMTHAYGYILGTRGADKDHIDVFIGPDPEGGKIVVIDQLNLKTGVFDEHKVMLGFPHQAHAMHAYLSNYDATGLDRIGTLNPAILPEEFKLWLAEADTTKPFAVRLV
jgi:hypothetical protein